MTKVRYLVPCLAIALAVGVVLVPASRSETGCQSERIDRSTLVLRLVAEGGAREALKAGRTGRAAFDQLTTTLGVEEVKRVFPVQPSSHPLSQLQRTMGLADWVVLSVPEGSDPAALLERFKDCPDVVIAEFDPIQHIAGAEVTPDDPYFLTHQYSLHNTGTQPPWDPGTSSRSRSTTRRSFRAPSGSPRPGRSTSL